MNVEKTQSRRRLDWLIAFGLLIVAAIPRLIGLEEIPPGLHGDEAWTGIDARRVLENGPIEPYVGSATGQPTGPLYLTALVFTLVGESIATLRLSMALFGIATVPLFYGLLRIYFDRPISVLVTLSFAFLLMHLHFSRLGFMLISAPVFQLGTFIALAWAVRQPQPIKFEQAGQTPPDPSVWPRLGWVTVAGLACGLGLYSYNAYLAFPPLVLAYLLYRVVFTRRDRVLRALQAITFTTALLVVTAPLTRIMVTNPDFYFARHQGHSILEMPQFQEAPTLITQAGIALAHIRDMLLTFVQAGQLDGVDAFGSFFNFLPAQLVLIGLGFLALVLHRKPEHLVLFGLGTLLLLSATLTFEGVYRRQILSLIPLFFLVAYGLHFWLGKLRQWLQPRLRPKVYTGIYASVIGALIIAIALESGYATYTYWSRLAADPGVRRVFAGDLVDTMHTYEQVSSPDSLMVFFTDGFYCNFESIRFILADDYACQGGRETNHTLFFDTQPQGPKTLVFMAPYHEYIHYAEAWTAHWGGTGERHDVTDDAGRLISILYVVDIDADHSTDTGDHRPEPTSSGNIKTDN